MSKDSLRGKEHFGDHLLQSMVIPDLFGNESDNDHEDNYMDDEARAERQSRTNKIKEEIDRQGALKCH